MIITHRSVNDINIVAISGRMLMTHAEEARGSLKKTIQDGNGTVLLDLSQLTFIDSSGCGVLISALKYTRTREGNIALCALTRNVRALLELTKVIELFSVFDTVEEALAAFGSNPD